MVPSSDGWESSPMSWVTPWSHVEQIPTESAAHIMTCIRAADIALLVIEYALFAAMVLAKIGVGVL